MNTWNKHQESRLVSIARWLKDQQQKERKAWENTNDTDEAICVREDRMLMLSLIEKELLKHFPANK